MLVGITGGIGSGKTTVANLFSQFENIEVYHADDEAKKLMNTSETIRERIIEEFSDEAYLEEGLNRPFLAKIVFEQKEKLKILNNIVHPEVYKHLNEFVNFHNDKEYILYENAILFENGSHKICDKIISVSVPQDIRVERVMKRDGVSKKAVLSRIKNQWLDIKKTIQSHYLIVNMDLELVKEEVLKIHNKLT